MILKLKQITRRTIIGILFLLVFVSVILLLPPVQTFFAKKVTAIVNEEFGISIEIDKIAITVWGDVAIKEVVISDKNNDSLFYSKTIHTNIYNLPDWYEGKLRFDQVSITDFKMKMIQYKGDSDTNLDHFVDAFDTGKKSESEFLMTIVHAELKNSEYSYYDYNQEIPRLAEFKKIDASTDNLLIKGPNFSTDIKKMSFNEYRGVRVENISARFAYTLKDITIRDIDLKTKKSKVKGNVILRYDRKDFSDFNNKVIFDASFYEGLIASEDLKCFYSEINTGQFFSLKTKIKGALNDITFYQLDLEGKEKLDVIGDLHFKNLFGKKGQPFSMDADFKKLTTNYESLIHLLPNILEPKLPLQLQKLKNISVRGKTYVTLHSIISDIKVQTEIGNAVMDFSFSDLNSDKTPKYIGSLGLVNFDIGSVLGEKKLGGITANLEVDGQGFSEADLNSKMKGVIKSVFVNKYLYKNITLDGRFKKPLFEGYASIDDPNIKMDFDGMVNFKPTENEYLFKSSIEYVDLYRIKLSTIDTLSILKGNLDIDLKGSTIDDVYGKIALKNGKYTNQIQTYNFTDFEIVSQFDADKVRTISINSPEIIQGEIKGKFKFANYRKIIENSLGSIYTHYSPHVLKEDQFATFDFKIYNQIVDIFFPEIKFGNNTYIKGDISTADNRFKLEFKSPSIKAYDNIFYNIDANIDNQQLLYNTAVVFDSLQTKKYTVTGFSFTNKTVNDTLFARAKFKGGDKNRDTYDINVFHTINEENKSVVGFKKSLLDFKKYPWHINEKNLSDQTIVFDKSIDKFSINNITINHENVSAAISGIVQDSTYKKINIAFKDVPLSKITPSIPNLVYTGQLNGAINIFQKESLYKPSAALIIENFKINDYLLGVFNLDISGTPDLKKFEVVSDIKKGSDQSFFAIGAINFEGNPSINLEVNLKDFPLETLSPLGETIITDVKGEMSGNASFVGSLYQPKVRGRCFINKGGLKIPYLNVNYDFKDYAIVDITEHQFIFKNLSFTDKEFKTEGVLGGDVYHNVFGDWLLNLKLKGNKLLVLNTQDSEDAIYYGKAFVNAEATIKGPTNALVMDVVARSQKGTEIKIPISDSESLGDNSFIKFISPNDKYNKNQISLTKSTKDYKGFEMSFDLDITPDAVLEVIIDRQSGHGIRGKGFGNVLLNINTLGKFNMWGNFIAHEGLYHFKYGGLIDKKFEVKNGGTIRWEGDPFKAVLNIEAIYKTQANPSVLIDNASFNKAVPVDVKIKLSDQLVKPELDFIIDFPTISSIQKSEIQYVLNEKNTRQTQALYLLSSGGFLSTSNAGANAVTGNLFERASSLINGALEDEDSKIKVGLNYVQRNNTALIQTGGRVGLTFKSEINERISLKGKFGVPTGVSQSNVIGEGSLDLRLSNDESFYASIFNKENDINYFGENIGYTQGVGISYKVDFNNLKSFLKKVKSKSNETPQKDDVLKNNNTFDLPKKQTLKEEK